MNSGDPLGFDNHLTGLKNSLLTVDEFIFELVVVTFFFGLFVTKGEDCCVLCILVRYLIPV